MEQVSENSQQQGQPQAPLECPRCGSLNTIFRYYNNYSRTQPRYYCKTCRRPWTQGGGLRDIPFGGRTKNIKQTKASSSRSQPLQPALPLREAHHQISPALTITGAGIISQNFDTTMIQHPIHMPTPISRMSSHHFNDNISGLDVMQTLIQPEFLNQSVNSGFQVFGGSTNMGIPQNWNIQPMLSQEVLPQAPMRIESQQTHSQANNITPDSYNNSVVPHMLPVAVNSLPQDNNFNFSTSNDLGNHHGDNSNDGESDTASVNVDEWLDLSGYDSS